MGSDEKRKRASLREGECEDSKGKRRHDTQEGKGGEVRPIGANVADKLAVRL